MKTSRIYIYKLIIFYEPQDIVCCCKSFTDCSLSLSLSTVSQWSNLKKFPKDKICKKTLETHLVCSTSFLRVGNILENTCLPRHHQSIAIIDVVVVVVVVIVFVSTVKLSLNIKLNGREFLSPSRRATPRRLRSIGTVVSVMKSFERYFQIFAPTSIFKSLQITSNNGRYGGKVELCSW